MILWILGAPIVFPFKKSFYGLFFFDELLRFQPWRLKFLKVCCNFNLWDVG
jgi:hypothetical protein